MEQELHPASLELWEHHSLNNPHPKWNLHHQQRYPESGQGCPPTSGQGRCGARSAGPAEPPRGRCWRRAGLGGDAARSPSAWSPWGCPQPHGASASCSGQARCPGREEKAEEPVRFIVFSTIHMERLRWDVQFAVIIFYMFYGKQRYAAGQGKLRLDLQLNLAESMQLSLVFHQTNLPVSPQRAAAKYSAFILL